MIARFLAQSPDSPAAMASLLLEGLAAEDMTRLRMTVAYATTAGAETLIAATELREDLDVSVVVGLDGLVTEPSALRRLNQHFDRARAWETREQHSIFHPKTYCLDDGEGGTRASMVAGSANLSASGLGRNREAGIHLAGTREELGDCLTAWDEWWVSVWNGSVELTDDLIDRYELEFRKHDRPLVQGDRVVIAEITEAEEPVGLAEHEAASLVIDAGNITGGAGNQLELPRAVVPFFGVDPDDRGREVRLTLTRGGASYAENVMRFYGSNNMWRLNIDTAVPDVVQGLHQRSVLFVRQDDPDHFRIKVLTDAERTAALNLARRAGAYDQTIAREYGWY